MSSDRFGWARAEPTTSLERPAGIEPGAPAGRRASAQAARTAGRRAPNAGPRRPRLGLWAAVAVGALGCHPESSPTRASGPVEVAGEPEADPAGGAGEAPTHASIAGSAAEADRSPEPAEVEVEADAEPVAAEPTIPRDPPPVEPKTVLILGDSLAATGFGALLQRKLDAHPAIHAHRKGKSASGLARPDYFDWPDEARRQVELRKPDVVVVIMGGNDGQDLTAKRGAGKRVAWQSAAWAQAYAERMEAFMDIIGGPGRTVIWLGLPTMELRSLERKLELIRALQREVVERRGGVYVDTAHLLQGEDGLPVRQARVGGKLATIREEDGIHFTMAGSQYFADGVYPAILGAIGLDSEP